MLGALLKKLPNNFKPSKKNFKKSVGAPSNFLADFAQISQYKVSQQIN
jgi:hypothetical protein